MMDDTDSPTPDSNPPAADEPKTPTRHDDRFKYNTHDGEWFESLNTYCPGGYHPVHLNDTFKDGRYKVIRKLGAGKDSTVWLANDRM
jgi:hypothetical protein